MAFVKMNCSEEYAELLKEHPELAERSKELEAKYQAARDSKKAETQIQK